MDPTGGLKSNVGSSPKVSSNPNDSSDWNERSLSSNNSPNPDDGSGPSGSSNIHSGSLQPGVDVTLSELLTFLPREMRRRRFGEVGGWGRRMLIQARRTLLQNLLVTHPNEGDAVRNIIRRLGSELALLDDSVSSPNGFAAPYGELVTRLQGDDYLGELRTARANVVSSLSNAETDGARQLIELLAKLITLLEHLPPRLWDQEVVIDENGREVHAAVRVTDALEICTQLEEPSTPQWRGWDRVTQDNQEEVRR